MIQDDLSDISNQLLKYWLSHNVYKDFQIFKCYISISKLILELNNSARLTSKKNEIENSKKQFHLYKQYQL